MSVNFNPIDRRIRKSKAALKDSLITLMQNKDFKEISITDIVQEADLNHGTFYKHYLSKENLLEEIINDVTADLVASYRQPYKDIEIFELKYLNSSGIKIFEHVARHSNFYTLVVKSDELYGFQNKFCEVLKNLALYDLIDCAPNRNINKELQASYQAYAIMGLIIEWINGGFKYDSSYMAEQLLEIIKSNHLNCVYKANINVE